MYFKSSSELGVTLVEVMMAISIVAAMVVAVGLSVTTYVTARSELLVNLKTVYLAEEGHELLRALRDEDWNNLDSLTIGNQYYFDISTTTISTSVTQEVIDFDYYRSFVLAEVYRDGDDDITSSTTPGATVDTELFEAKVSVFGPVGTTTFTSIIANIHAI